MKLTKLMILPILLVLGACSATYSPQTDHSSKYDFSAVKTFKVIGDEHLPNPMVSDITRDRIDAALTTVLTEHGKLESDPESADVLIRYFVVTKDKLRVDSTITGGYGRFGSYGYGGASHISSRAYVEGTLVIDVIDNKSHKTVWRSTLTKSLKSYNTNQKRDQAIKEAIASMITELPAR